MALKYAPPPLAEEIRTVLNTPEMAYHFSNTDQTMRRWACTGRGPIQPLRVGGRLKWLVADAKRVLGVV